MQTQTSVVRMQLVKWLFALNWLHISFQSNTITSVVTLNCFLLKWAGKCMCPLLQLIKAECYLIIIQYYYIQILEDSPSSSEITSLLHLYARAFILFQNGFLNSVKHGHDIYLNSNPLVNSNSRFDFYPRRKCFSYSSPFLSEESWAFSCVPQEKPATARAELQSSVTLSAALLHHNGVN